jgi:hypothetical protein
MGRTVELPDSIKVGGLVFKVHLVKDLKSADKPCFGTMSWDEQRINLDSAIPTKEFVANIVWHEVMHALWAYFDIPTKGEETKVLRIANGITMIMKDNPQLMDYIMKAYK